MGWEFEGYGIEMSRFIAWEGHQKILRRNEMGIWGIWNQNVEIYCVGGTSKDFEKKWDGNLRDMESKCWYLLRGRDIKRLWEEMGWEFEEYGIEISRCIIRRTL